LAAGVLLALGLRTATAQTTTPTTPTTTTTTTTPQTSPIQQGTAPQANQTVTLKLYSPQVTATAAGVPSSSNPNAAITSAYADYLSLGDPRNFTKGAPKWESQKATFGQEGIYTKKTTTTTTAAAATASSAQGFTTYGTVRNPAYTTALGKNIPTVKHDSAVLEANLRAVINRASNIPSKGTIGVTVTGSTVELSGVVADKQERRIVEAMVRMSPGVRNVTNLLQTSAE
jgi:hypothetical protein